MRVLIMGCGGLGGCIAAALSECGTDVLAVTHNPAIAKSIQENGYILEDGDSTRRVRGRAVATLRDNGPFDVILLATPPNSVVEAARTALPTLAAQGIVVCLQNGVCETRVAEVAGADRVVGAVVGWGASMPAVGVYDRTSDGGFSIGRVNGEEDAQIASLADLLRPIGPVAITANLLGARWSKLAINCAISSLGTIGGTRLGQLIRRRPVRRMALEVMTEAALTARGLDIRLEKIAGTIDLDMVTLTAAEALGGNSPALAMKHAILLAVGLKFRRLRSSMLAAIERGREPAVDYLNGEVVEHGAGCGVLTPLNHRVQQTIHAIADGQLRPGLDLLERVYRESRDEVRESVVARIETASRIEHPPL